MSDVIRNHRGLICGALLLAASVAVIMNARVAAAKAAQPNPVRVASNSGNIAIAQPIKIWVFATAEPDPKYANATVDIIAMKIRNDSNKDFVWTTFHAYQNDRLDAVPVVITMTTGAEWLGGKGDPKWGTALLPGASTTIYIDVRHSEDNSFCIGGNQYWPRLCSAPLNS